MKQRKNAKQTSGAWRPSVAMVLAAGMGSRMRPLTDSVPKPLVKIKGKALIDFVLDRIGEAGIGHAVVNVHYKADMLTGHLAGRRSPEVTISDERERLLDTGGGIVKALPKLGSGPFLVHNADSTWIEGIGSNIVTLCETWDPDRMDFLLLVALASNSVGYDGRGDFQMQPDGLMVRRREREMAPFAFTGVSIAHPRAFADAPAGAFSINTLWTRAIEQRRLFGVRLDGIWMHVGTPEAVIGAEARIDEING